MKIAYLLLLVALAVGVAQAGGEAAVSDAKLAKRLSDVVLTADHAERQIAESDRAKGLVAPVVRDRRWIEDFAQALASARLTPCTHILAVSTCTLFIGKDGACLLSIEELPGNALRLNGSDYEVDSDSAGKLHALLTKWPNQALLPTPMAVT